MILQEQFRISYEVTKGFVKATGSGQIKNDDGELISYLASVRIFSTNIYQSNTENDKTMFANSYDRQLAFKISCDSDIKAGKLANLVQSTLISSQPIFISGDIPVRKTDGTYEVNVFDIKGIDMDNLDKVAIKK